MRNAVRPLTRRPLLAVGTVLIAVLAIGTGVLASLHASRATTTPVYTPPKRARSYTDYSACLLTGPNGISDAAVAPVWAGMESASKAAQAQVSYLALPVSQSTSDAADFINALAMRGCELILTSGTAAGEGAANRATALPHIHFITVDAPGVKADNLTAITATTPSTITRAVEALVTKAANQSSATP